ncbi:hypothetical protein OAG71_00415 [bacterium]|nr:hypothetical protein [bacterium]
MKSPLRLYAHMVMWLGVLSIIYDAVMLFIAPEFVYSGSSNMLSLCASLSGAALLEVERRLNDVEAKFASSGAAKNSSDTE